MSADDQTAVANGLPAFFGDMDPEMFRRRFGRAWTFEVVEAFDITPAMRRVIYTADDIEQMSYKAGQEIIMMIPQAGGQPERRYYTIRSFDAPARQLAVDFVLHGSSVAGDYCRAVKPGDRLTVLGPRGRHVIRDGADWRLFVGDESALPAIFGMVETLPERAKAYILVEIGEESDKQAVKSDADIALHWIMRDAPAGQSRVLIEAASAFVFPTGVGHVYILGETSVIRAVRQGLIARGLAKDRISAEGYWRPGRIGGHEHVDD